MRGMIWFCCVCPRYWSCERFISYHKIIYGLKSYTIYLYKETTGIQNSRIWLIVSVKLINWNQAKTKSKTNEIYCQSDVGDFLINLIDIGNASVRVANIFFMYILVVKRYLFTVWVFYLLFGFLFNEFVHCRLFPL